jgi:hypothetical protein
MEIARIGAIGAGPEQHIEGSRAGLHEIALSEGCNLRPDRGAGSTARQIAETVPPDALAKADLVIEATWPVAGLAVPPGGLACA